MTGQDLLIQDLRRENKQLRLREDELCTIIDELMTKLKKYEEGEHGDRATD